MFTEEEVYKLMIQSFNAGFNKHDVVEAGLESKLEDVECSWILQKYIRERSHT